MQSDFRGSILPPDAEASEAPAIPGGSSPALAISGISPGGWQDLQVYRDHVRGLAIRETETVQLGLGDPTFHSIRALGVDLNVVRLRVMPELAGHTVVDPEWLVLMAPLATEGQYVFNGWEAQPGQVFLSVSGDGFASSGSRRDTVGIGIRKGRMKRACAALAGVPAEAISYTDMVLEFGATAGAVFRNRFIQACTAAPRISDGSNDVLLSPVVENNLIDMAAREILPFLAAEAAGESGQIDPYRIVLIAEDAAALFNGRLPTLSDLCAAAGVGRSRLHECFMEIYGTSPQHYLKHKRLTKVREWLLDGDAPPRSIKDAALAYGFFNNGRFATSYRNLFGELPSSTFARAQAG